MEKNVFWEQGFVYFFLFSYIEIAEFLYALDKWYIPAQDALVPSFWGLDLSTYMQISADFVLEMGFALFTPLNSCLRYSYTVISYTAVFSSFQPFYHMYLHREVKAGHKLDKCDNF